ncbi:ectonucleoside triphosphate diphosphohydrolase 2-like [Simochromis diagramma]|uniref:ectonucleoside triphosphate diphosphohydrolase 2-like n=1 Tax=Simochromis diagramma TaxID=43689 RepID=UPI001A7EA61F|nr:ectonucleoside triphosphate diphosphohydrolase 2-like [Simochromis diagramma]
MGLRCSQTVPAVALIVVAVVGILLLVLPAKEMALPPENMYGIVLDAGSSHTSMYIYKWPADKQNNTGIVTQHDECNVEGGGISSYADNPSGAAKSLEKCLEQALTHIPKFRHHQTPLCLGATAGMRLLSITNASKSQRVMKEVENKLQSYPFKFKESIILSGQAEGVFGWVTVNYLLENFVKYGFVGHWMNPGRDTIGALDLGGASTQITFETSEKAENKSNTMELKLFGKTYRLYTQSFLCYGQDQYLRKLLAHLIKDNYPNSTVFHPCYPKQFSESVILGKDVFDSPCTVDSKPDKIDLEMNVNVVGTGDYQNCLKNVKKIFSFENCKYSKCSFNGVFQPSLRGRFMAFSAFYFTHKYISTLTNMDMTSPNQTAKAVRRVCSMSISEMTNRTKQHEKYMKNVCAVSNFVQVLLTQGYHFNEVSLPSISFEKKAGGASVGWALGYMLNLTNLVPAENPVVMKALPIGPWKGILFLSIILIFFALGYLLFVYRKAKANEGMV